MSDNHNHIRFYERSPLYQLAVSMMVVIGLGTIIFTAFTGAGLLIFGVNSDLLNNPSKVFTGDEINFMRYILITQDISLFIIPAIIILRKLKPLDHRGFPDMRLPEVKDIGLIIVLAFCIFPVTGLTGYLNSLMHLPDWLSGLEKWMTEKEESASGMVNALMKPEGFGVMILNLFLVAMLPAISEELIFRGVFQKILTGVLRSAHKAIWITAFVFSFMHFQFFGFVPRFILGLVFGYLFFWGGTLWLPVIAHFVNNAVPVISSYLHGLDKANSLEDIPVWQQLLALPVPLIISIAIFSYFRNKREKENKRSSGNIEQTV
jgi:membrane protease YdiL (CAAX protease family)